MKNIRFLVVPELGSSTKPSLDEIEIFESAKGVTTKRIQHGHSETSVYVDELHVYGGTKIGVQPRNISKNTIVNFFIEILLR